MSKFAVVFFVYLWICVHETLVTWHVMHAHSTTNVAKLIESHHHGPIKFWRPQQCHVRRDNWPRSTTRPLLHKELSQPTGCQVVVVNRDPRVLVLHSYSCYDMILISMTPPAEPSVSSNYTSLVAFFIVFTSSLCACSKLFRLYIHEPN